MGLLAEMRRKAWQALKSMANIMWLWTWLVTLPVLCKAFKKADSNSMPALNWSLWHNNFQSYQQWKMPELFRGSIITHFTEHRARLMKTYWKKHGCDKRFWIFVLSVSNIIDFRRCNVKVVNSENVKPALAKHSNRISPRKYVCYWRSVFQEILLTKNVATIKLYTSLFTITYCWWCLTATPLPQRSRNDL